jgi:BirA family biotin operon repressor/biotin-[acetyl-CoA-carboxylase] ligase
MNSKMDEVDIFEKIRHHEFEIPVFVLGNVESTNVEAKKIQMGGMPPPFAVLERLQSASYGKVGRRWVGDIAGNLYFSYAIKIRNWTGDRAEYLMGSIATGICGVISEKFSVDGHVKMPNDIFVCGKKVGGVLAEIVRNGGTVLCAVLGVGVNILSAPDIENAKYEAACLQDFIGTELDFGAVAVEIIERIIDSVKKFENIDFCARA